MTAHLPPDLWKLLLFFGVFAIYLLLSALTEMGTRWPWQEKNKRL